MKLCRVKQEAGWKWKLSVEIWLHTGSPERWDLELSALQLLGQTYLQPPASSITKFYL